jgi:DNA-binding CsgD family transcriptional regulator/PAS domain-containing protein
MRRYESLLDAIDLAYQAALEPGLWPSVLAATAEGFQASRALILYGGSSSNSIVASRADEPLTDTYFSEFKVINPIQQVLDSRWGSRARPPAYSDQDLVPRPDLVRSDFYDGFLRPADMHSILMLPLGQPYAATVNIFRGHHAQTFERSEIELGARMQRSLTRAWTMGERLGARRAVDEALAAFIDRLPGAVLLVSADGRVMHANGAAQAILAARDGLSAPAGILEAESLQARPQLRRLIAQAAVGDAERRAGGAMAVPRPSDKRPFAVQVAPARGEPALTMSQAPLVLVCISDPEAHSPPPIERLREMFGLTAAESRVALALFEGSSLRDVAEAAGVSIQTVRNQLVRIFEKTGANRQAALIGLMMRANFAQLD